MERQLVPFKFSTKLCAQPLPFKALGVSGAITDSILTARVVQPLLDLGTTLTQACQFSDPFLFKARQKPSVSGDCLEWKRIMSLAYGCFRKIDFTPPSVPSVKGFCMIMKVANVFFNHSTF